MIERRAVTTGLLSIAGAPGIVRGQSPRAMCKIGYLNASSISPPTATLIILRLAWQRLGYVEGETVLLRSAERDLNRVPSLIAELVDRGCGAIIVVGADAVKAARKATSTTPIVAIDLETDPVRAGLADSFARPGGNVTGLFLDLPSLAGKWVTLMQEVAPSIERIAIGWDPRTGQDQLVVAKGATQSRGVSFVVFETPTYGDFDAVFERLGDLSQTGAIHLSSPGFSLVAEKFARAAQKHRMPTSAFLKAYANAGVLMTYGPHHED